MGLAQTQEQAEKAIIQAIQHSNQSTEVSSMVRKFQQAQNMFSL